ncbi:MAG: homoserine O-acetyltransferase [Bacteroidales bacterium]|nr:homoserine O-acetyltransferase [Bacteroidales bacterium]
MSKIFRYDNEFRLECGEVLPSLKVAYHTFGSMNEERSNVVWVCHALTANSDVADWWPGTVESGRFLDPEKYFVVCANILGSCYGTTGPTEINPATGQPWYGDFPRVTVRDMVRAHQLLAQHLGIKRVKLLIGSSVGGFQSMEWSVMEPDFAEKCAFIATGAYFHPWAAAFHESQQMALLTDPTFGERTPEAGLKGMAAARSIALLSYRGGKAYDKTQADAPEGYASPFEHRVQSYQRYQGEKLCRRFNAYAYQRMLQACDSHNLGRGRGSVEQALQCIKAPTLLVSISSDLLFPPCDHQVMIDNIPNCEYHEIDSDFGHDGFLVESDKLNDIIQAFMN